MAQTLSKSGTVQDPENTPTENHPRTTIEVEASARRQGRTFGCSPLMEGSRRMYTKSDTVNRARANESNAEFLQRGESLRQLLRLSDRSTMRGELTWPAKRRGPNFRRSGWRGFEGTLRLFRSNRLRARQAEDTRPGGSCVAIRGSTWLNLSYPRTGTSFSHADVTGVLSNNTG